MSPRRPRAWEGFQRFLSAQRPPPPPPPPPPLPPPPPPGGGGFPPDDGDDFEDDDSYFGNEITLYNELDEPISRTKDQWLEAAGMLSLDDLWDRFYMEPLDIMYQMENMDLLTKDDWDYWRELYEAYH
jgi:hypothetical protein